MSLETEAIKALQSGELASNLISNIGKMWLILMIGLPIAGMILYKYVLTSFVDRFILFISNKAWTDKGKLIEMRGEKWIIESLGLFRVYLVKGCVEINRGKKEYMKKTLVISIPKYLNTEIVYYEYPNLYTEEDMDIKKFTAADLHKLIERIDSLEKKSSL